MEQVQSYIDHAYIDHGQARFNMVHNLLRPNQVIRPDIIDALMAIPRERFLPKELQNICYIDSDLPLGDGRFMMCPLSFSKLLQVSNIQDDDIVLDIGCLTGYSTAIIGKLAASVTGIDINPLFLSQATEETSKLEILNTIFHYAELNQGFPKNAPYSLIFIEGEVDFVPPAILDQLSDHGRLITIVRTHPHQKVAKIYQKIGQKCASRDLFDLNAKPLHGFQQPKGFTF